MVGIGPLGLTWNYIYIYLIVSGCFWKFQDFYMSMNLMVSENLGNDVIVRFTTAERCVPSLFLASRSRRYDSSGPVEAYRIFSGVPANGQRASNHVFWRLSDSEVSYGASPSHQVRKWSTFGYPGTLVLELVGGLEHEFYDFPFSWEFHHPNWRSHIQGGRSTTNQVMLCPPPSGIPWSSRGFELTAARRHSTRSSPLTSSFVQALRVFRLGSSNLQLINEAISLGVCPLMTRDIINLY